MRTAGIREVRQNLSALLREVRQGREIVITDRGEPVARLTPPARGSAKPFPDLGAFRRRLPTGSPPISPAIAEDRADRG
jgi:prevent-host-death family protein